MTYGTNIQNYIKSKAKFAFYNNGFLMSFWHNGCFIGLLDYFFLFCTLKTSCE